jgi:hypothetical protein
VQCRRYGSAGTAYRTVCVRWTIALRRRRADRPDLALHYRLRPGGDVIERRITAGHAPGVRGGALELLRAGSATWTPPYRDSQRMSQPHGRRAAETQLVRSPLTPATAG